MLESVSTDSRHYPQERGARFAEGGGRFTAMPYDAAPSLSHLEASRALLGLAAAARRGAPFLARGAVSSRRKTSRVVIARTIIDGSTSEMRESSGVSDGKLARRLTGKATSWACAEPVALLPQAPRGNKANVTAPEMLDSAFRQNFDEILPGI
jgi:hypothetical protein